MGIILDKGLADLILEKTSLAGIVLTQNQVRLLCRHIELMLSWNTRLNLTRITALEEIIIKHLLDSILPARSLPSHGHALDVGTGAGFPGIPLKIVRPDLEMVLLDASRKKVSFLVATTAALGLQGVRALHGRWEQFSRLEENKDKFQLITMRAVKLEPEHLSTLASGILSADGVFAWWCGPESEREAEKAAEQNYPCVKFTKRFSYLLPGMKNQRAVWIWKKSGNSP